MDRPDPLSPQSVEKSLRHSIFDGCLYAAMLGCGEVFLIPFAIFQHADSLVVGLLASAPLLLGSLAQLASTRIMDRARERRGLILRSALAQSFTWLPIFFLPWLWPARGPLLLLGGAVLYFVFANLITPAWNSLMGDLVDPAKRGAYFGHRNRLCNLFTVLSFVASGLWLHWSRTSAREWEGYGALFMLAMVLRLLSFWQLGKMVEPPYVPPTREQRFTFLEFLRATPRSNFAKFVFATAAMQFATNIAGPFFVLYLLRDLGFSYTQYIAAVSASLVTQTLTLHGWGRISDSFGNRKVLITSSLIMPLVPLVWLVSAQYWYIIVIQAFAGFVWAGFSLSCQNFIFDAVTPPKRMRCVAYFNLVTNVSIFAGATFGGWLNLQFPNPIGLFGHRIPLVSTLPLLFLISGLLRIVTAFALIPIVREVRAVEPITPWGVLFRVSGLRPVRGFILSLFNGGHPGNGSPPLDNGDRRGE